MSKSQRWSSKRSPGDAAHTTGASGGGGGATGSKSAFASRSGSVKLHHGSSVTIAEHPDEIIPEASGARQRHGGDGGDGDTVVLRGGSHSMSIRGAAGAAKSRRRRSGSLPGSQAGSFRRSQEQSSGAAAVHHDTDHGGVGGDGARGADGRGAGGRDANLPRPWSAGADLGSSHNSGRRTNYPQHSDGESGSSGSDALLAPLASDFDSTTHRYGDGGRRQRRDRGSQSVRGGSSGGGADALQGQRDAWHARPTGVGGAGGGRARSHDRGGAAAGDLADLRAAQLRAKSEPNLGVNSPASARSQQQQQQQQQRAGRMSQQHVRFADEPLVRHVPENANPTVSE